MARKKAVATESDNEQKIIILYNGDGKPSAITRIGRDPIQGVADLLFCATYLAKEITDATLGSLGVALSQTPIVEQVDDR